MALKSVMLGVSVTPFNETVRICVPGVGRDVGELAFVFVMFGEM